MGVNRVTVYPRFAPAYASFFFEGVHRLWGPSCVRYSTEGFPTHDPESRLLRIRIEGERKLRICVEADDMPDLDTRALEWCDVFAKVNLDSSLAPSHERAKLVAAGPTFGVRAWSAPAAARAFLRCRRVDPFARVSVHGRGFWAQLRDRVPEQAYCPGVSDPDYIFFVAWPWKRHAAVNPPRARFIEECLAQPNLQFEGGFVPRRRDDMPEIRGLTADQRYPLAKYLARMCRSAIAFNTPAVHDCLGWKLGEFLALGKAIVTLPLTRELPSPLEHGRHVHVVDGSANSIRGALELIRRDAAYRTHLEQNARLYYDTWLAPDRLMARILGLSPT